MSQPVKRPPPPALTAPAAPSATAPAKRVAPPAAAAVKATGPAAQPHPRPAGLPPNAIIIKTLPALAGPPQQSSTSESTPQHSRSGSKTGPSTSSPAPPPSVPANSWYAQPFAEPVGTAMSSFHREHRGKIVFSARAVSVEAADLQGSPEQAPPTLTVCTVGKDLLYGMSYLYSTPLVVEHQWRGRVGHLLRVRQQQAPVPDAVRRGLEGLANLQKQQQHAASQGGAVPPPGSTRKPRASAATSATGGGAATSPSATPPPTSLPGPSTGTGAAAPSLDYASTMRFSRGEAAVYGRPTDDLLIGLKVYVNEDLVEDHYPDVHALPQCTSTIVAREAAFSWNCVPFVLMGYLNQTMLDPVTLFHSLSLNFVEHLLHVKLPVVAAADPPTKRAPAVELPLRVEVVYGCRAEAYYCTDFIARGRCVLRITEATKPALKTYEEKLRTLVKARRGAPQLITRSASGVPPPRACGGCGHPLQFCCTVCGAEVCGRPTCALRVVLGYPRACSKHLPLS